MYEAKCCTRLNVWIWFALKELADGVTWTVFQSRCEQHPAYQDWIEEIDTIHLQIQVTTENSQF